MKLWEGERVSIGLFEKAWAAKYALGELPRHYSSYPLSCESEIRGGSGGRGRFAGL
jgi:hypothetical protein